jgi:flagellin-like protein
MANQKGITPIIATLVLLLVTVAIAGAAWIYITTYVGGMTKVAFEFTTAECTSTQTVVYLHNIGTEDLTSTNVAISRELLGGGAGDCNSTSSASIKWEVDPINPGMTKKITDPPCNGTRSTAARYTFIAGGRIQRVTISCP